MRRKIVIFCLSILATFLVLPIPLPGDDGAYNTISRMTWCTNPQACAHERGHALDQSLGWPSQTQEFTFDVQVYVIAEMRSDQPSHLAAVIMKAWRHPPTRLGANPNAELYAQIYQAAGGNIPAGLRKYYGGTN